MEILRVINQKYKTLFSMCRYNTQTMYKQNISLVSEIEEVIEKCAKIQLNRFIINENALSNQQFDFKENIGCQEAMTFLSNLIYRSLDVGRWCLSIFLDISKAFDSISHELILHKLKSIIGYNQCWA